MADLTTADLRKLLAKRVLGPDEQGGRAYYLEEVELGGRRADAISVGLWRSRGQLIEGYEIKTNRRDWLSEYQDHAKAEPAMAICDHFWLVTVPGVVQPGELPESWGLLLAIGRNRHLKIDKPAPRLRDADVTHPVSREALVRLLRRIDALGIEAKNAIRDEAREEAEKRVGLDRGHLENQIASLQGHLREQEEGWATFHAKLGLQPWQWRPTEEDFALIGKIAEAVRDGDAQLKRMHDDVRRLEGNAGDLVGRLNDTLAEMDDRLYGRGQAA